MSQGVDEYHSIKHPSKNQNFLDARQIYSRESIRESVKEIQLNELSGDEANEKSFVSLNTMARQQDQKASLFLSGMTVLKSMVGVGILGIPNVAKNFGIIPLIVLILFVFGCTNFSTDLLIRSKNMSGRSNYTTIAYFIYNTQTVIVTINVIIIVSNLGVCLSELIIFGTTCENLISIYFGDTLQLPFFLQRWFLMIVVGILLIPLITVKQIEKLRFVSLIAVISLTSFTIVVVYNFFNRFQNYSLASDYNLFPTDFDFKEAFSVLPNIIFAYNWHINQFPVYKGMVKPRDSRIKNSAWMGTGLGTILYLVVGILGYMTYGSRVETNFLKTISIEDTGKPLYIFLNIAFTLSTTLTLPLLFYGSRNNCIAIINQFECLGGKKTKTKIAILDLNEETPKMSSKPESGFNEERKLIYRKKQDQIFYLTSLVLEFIVVVAAIFVTELQIVFNLLGAVGANAISTGMPALFYYKCVQKVDDYSQLRSKQKQLYYLVRGYFCYSIFLVVICVGSEILSIAQGKG